MERRPKHNKGSEVKRDWLGDIWPSAMKGGEHKKKLQRDERWFAWEIQLKVPGG